MKGGTRVLVYYTAQDDPRKNTALRLKRKNLARIIDDPKKVPNHCVLLNPFAKKALSREDLPTMQKYGLLALDCSWEQAEDMFPLLQGKVRSRALPFLVAANNVNYGKPFKLSTAEAIGAALWIAGDEFHGRRVLAAVGLEDQFAELNEQPLADYSACETSAEVVEAQAAFL